MSVFLSLGNSELNTVIGDRRGLVATAVRLRIACAPFGEGARSCGVRDHRPRGFRQLHPNAARPRACGEYEASTNSRNSEWKRCSDRTMAEQPGVVGSHHLVRIASPAAIKPRKDTSSLCARTFERSGASSYVTRLQCARVCAQRRRFKASQFVDSRLLPCRMVTSETGANSRIVGICLTFSDRSNASFAS